MTKQYVVLAQTVDPDSGMIYVSGLIGVFDDLQRALNTVNQALGEMGVPDFYDLGLKDRSSGMIPVDETGRYYDKDFEEPFWIKIDVAETELNRRYTKEDQVV